MQIKDNGEKQYRLESALKGLKYAWKRHVKKKSLNTECSVLVSQKILESQYKKMSTKLASEFKNHMDEVRKIKSQCPHPEEMDGLSLKRQKIMCGAHKVLEKS